LNSNSIVKIKKLLKKKWKFFFKWFTILEFFFNLKIIIIFQVFIMLALIHFHNFFAFKDEKRLKGRIMQVVDNVFLKEEKCQQIIVLLNWKMHLWQQLLYKPKNCKFFIIFIIFIIFLYYVLIICIEPAHFINWIKLSIKIFSLLHQLWHNILVYLIL